ncbi:MAG TPA: hypothetical protein VGP01_00835 [Rhizomicrobium sp.]|nr:hypothetical protein [Rhizomicrobium sp.]
MRWLGMMSVAALALIPSILFSGAAGGQSQSQTDDVALFHALLAKQCPAKHLEWLSTGELDDLIEVNFHDALPGSFRTRLDAANENEKRACASGTGGLACFNAAYIRAIGDVNLLPSFAKMVCVSGLSCKGQSDCEKP